MKAAGCSRISVVTVVKNGACNLEATIISVIEQKASAEIDYIVVDGGSTDGTPEIVSRYADHISWWVSEQDRGIYDAMNKGWAAAADGSFILFLGSGDRIISLPHAMDCYGQQDVVYGSVLMGEKAIFKARADYHLKLYNSLHHQALLVNKSMHPAPPFNSLYRVYGDFDFNQRLKKKGANFIYAPEFVAYAQPGGLSDGEDFLESLKVIQTNYGWFWKLFAIIGFTSMKVFPCLKRLRPF